MSLPQVDHEKCCRWPRLDKEIVRATLKELNVSPSQTFVDFYESYGGPHYSFNYGCHLGDITEDSWSIKATTIEARAVLKLPQKFLCLAGMEDNGSITLLDTETDCVYLTDVDDGVERVIDGCEPVAAKSFYEFLEQFFRDSDADR